VRARALERLCRYAWPGNVRELEHAITRAAILADRDVLDLPDFPQLVPPAPARPACRNGTGASRRAAGGEGDAADPVVGGQPRAHTT